MPDRPPHNPHGVHRQQQQQASRDAVQKIIADAETANAQVIRLSGLVESYRRTLYLMIQNAGGEVVIDKAVANLLNGQAGLSRIFEVVADDPTRPDSIIYRVVPTPDNPVLQIDTAKTVDIAEVQAAMQRQAENMPTFTWAVWEIELIIGDKRGMTYTNGAHSAVDVVYGLNHDYPGNKLVCMRLRGMTGTPPELPPIVLFSETPVPIHPDTGPGPEPEPERSPLG